VWYFDKFLFLTFLRKTLITWFRHFIFILVLQKIELSSQIACTIIIFLSVGLLVLFDLIVFVRLLLFHDNNRYYMSNAHIVMVRTFDYWNVNIWHQHHVSQEEVIRQCREQKLKDVIYELASAAYNHLSKVSAFILLCFTWFVYTCLCIKSEK